MKSKKIVTLALISMLCSISIANPKDGNEWWHFLNKKYHFNIEKNFDVYHEVTKGFSITYLDLRFDSYERDPEMKMAGRNRVDISKDFVIKYEKKEIQGDMINYTNALLINKGQNSHDACKANYISLNKKTKKITATSCSFTRLFDDLSNRYGFSDNTRFLFVK